MTELELLEQIAGGIKVCGGALMCIVMLVFVGFNCLIWSRWWKK